jgi:hypothetical protein
MSVTKTVLIATVLAGLTGTAHADERFSARTLRGAWGFNAQGFLAANTPAQTPASAVGRNTYDGVGQCTSEAKLNVGGTVLALTATSCTYTVDPDGTGIQQTTYPAGSFTTHFVLVEHASEFLFTVADAVQPGTTVASGIAKRSH